MSWRSMILATAVAKADPVLTETHGDVVELSEGDAQALRRLVAAVLAAFRRSDATGAFVLMSRPIRSAFEGPEELYTLLAERFPAFLDTDQVRFGGFVITPEGFGQRVTLRTTDGGEYDAVMLFAREVGDAWRIHGALVVHEDAELKSAA